MKVAHLSEPAEERVVFRDGLGVRERRETTAGEVVEWCHLDPAFAAVEHPLRERVARLTKLQHAKFARIMGLEAATKGRGPILVSSHVAGTRLSEVLEMARHGLLTFEPGAGLQVTREVLAGLAVLHDSRNVSHGALAPERVVLTAPGRIVMVEHVLAHALDRLQRQRHQLWREWRIPTPPAAGPVRLDMQTDLAQAGLLALAALLGRPLEEDEYPHRLRGLLPLVQDRLARSPAASIGSDVLAWLERLAPVDSRRAFKTVREAQQGFEGLVSGGAAALGISPARVKSVMAAVTAILGAPAGTSEAAAPVPTPDAAAPVVPQRATARGSGRARPVVVDSPEPRVVAESPADSDIDIDALLRLEEELEGGTSAGEPAVAFSHSAAPAREAAPAPVPEPVPSPLDDERALETIAQERVDLERQFAELVASVAPAVDGPAHLIPETPATSEPLVDARVLWSSMPAVDLVDATETPIDDVEAREEPTTEALAELAPSWRDVVVDPLDETIEAPESRETVSVDAPEASAPFATEPIEVAMPAEAQRAGAVEHVPAEWWKEALPWRRGESPDDASVPSFELCEVEHADLDQPADAVAAQTAEVEREATESAIVEIASAEAGGADVSEAMELPAAFTSERGVGEDFGYLTPDASDPTLDAPEDAVEAPAAETIVVDEVPVTGMVAIDTAIDLGPDSRDQHQTVDVVAAEIVHSEEPEELGAEVDEVVHVEAATITVDAPEPTDAASDDIVIAQAFESDTSAAVVEVIEATEPGGLVEAIETDASDPVSDASQVDGTIAGSEALEPDFADAVVAVTDDADILAVDGVEAMADIDDPFAAVAVDVDAVDAMGDHAIAAVAPEADAPPVIDGAPEVFVSLDTFEVLEAFEAPEPLDSLEMSTGAIDAADAIDAGAAADIVGSIEGEAAADDLPRGQDDVIESAVEAEVAPESLSNADDLMPVDVAAQPGGDDDQSDLASASLEAELTADPDLDATLLAAPDLDATRAADSEDASVSADVSLGGEVATEPAGAYRLFADFSPIGIREEADVEASTDSDSPFDLPHVDGESMNAAASLLSRGSAGADTSDWRDAFVGTSSADAPAESFHGSLFGDPFAAQPIVDAATENDLPHTIAETAADDAWVSAVAVEPIETQEIHPEPESLVEVHGEPVEDVLAVVAEELFAGPDTAAQPEALVQVFEFDSANGPANTEPISTCTAVEPEAEPHSDPDPVESVALAAEVVDEPASGMDPVLETEPEQAAGETALACWAPSESAGPGGVGDAEVADEAALSVPDATPSVPVVVVVDEGVDGEAWHALLSEGQHVPSNASASADVAAVVGATELAAQAEPVEPIADREVATSPIAVETASGSRRKKKRSRRKKGTQPEAAPTLPVPDLVTTAVGPAMPPVVVEVPAPAEGPSILAEEPEDEERSALAARASLLEREVPAWTPPADLTVLRPRGAQLQADRFSAPQDVADAHVAQPTSRHAETSGAVAQVSAPGAPAPARTGPAAISAPTTLVPNVPVSSSESWGASAAVTAHDAYRPFEQEIRAVGMPDLEEFSSRSGRTGLTSMADPIGHVHASASTPRAVPIEPRLIVGAPEPSRGMNWRRLVAASVLIALFQGVAFAAWWWVQPGAQGTLVVQTSKIGVEVLLDDKVVGRTPFREEVAPGRHKLGLRQGTNVREMPVEISVGVVTTQAIDWPSLSGGRGNLQVTSNPAGAEVFVNGKSRGDSPLLLEDLPAGDQVLTLKSDAGTVTVTTTVVPDETTPVEVKIFAGWILVDAPVEVNLHLNGREKIGSSMDGQILLPPGTHRVQAINEGLGIRQWFSVTVEPGAVRRVPFTVAPATLTLQEEAEVFVDGTSVGTTPGTISIQPGTHDIIIRPVGGAERRQALTVRSRQRVEF